MQTFQSNPQFATPAPPDVIGGQSGVAERIGGPTSGGIASGPAAADERRPGGGGAPPAAADFPTPPGFKWCRAGPIPFLIPSFLNCPGPTTEGTPSAPGILSGPWNAFRDVSSFFGWLGDANHLKGVGLLLVAGVGVLIGLVLWSGHGETAIRLAASSRDKPAQESSNATL